MNRNSHPLITVYVTNHNYGRFLRQAISSLFEQTFQDFEIILIDDGSTDNSREIIENYFTGTGIQIIYQKNQGLNVTNNIALRVARGKYVMRLDADDYLDKNALLVMSNMLENDEALGLVFPDYYLVDVEGNILGLERRHTFDKEVTLLDQPAHGACTMIRRSFLLEVGGYNESFACQDGYDLWVKFVTKYKITNVNLPLFYYRRHGSNLTKNEERLLSTRYEIKRLHFDEHCDPIKTMALLPIRGPKINPGSYDLERLGGKVVIDWIIEEALRADKVSHLIVTSPDEQIKDHVLTRYRTHHKFIFYGREEKQARLNVGLIETVQEILAHPEIQQLNFEAILRLSSEYPFITAENMNDAIHTMAIFGADSLISVRPETNLFFQHTGNGLEPILNREKFTRLEREALYRFTGGLNLTRINLFETENTFLGGRVGHIVIPQKETFSIRSDFDLQVARMIAAQHVREN
jgi:CMP-N-acetylneuraminic acid synthetase